MQQGSTAQTGRTSRRIVMTALAAALVLGGPALHLSASVTRADCQSSNGVTMVSGTENESCSTSVSDGRAVAQSGDGSTDEALVIQSSDSPTSAGVACPPVGTAAGPTLVLAPSLVLSSGVGCPAPLPAPVVSPPASGSLTLVGSGGCGSPSMVLGPGGISMSSGGC